MTSFASLKHADPDPLFILNTRFAADQRKEKVNLGVGVFCNDDGAFYSFECIEKARLRFKDCANYLPIDGDDRFVKAAGECIFGSADLQRSFGFQSPGGTGALRVIGELFALMGIKNIVLPTPTWANHANIFTKAGLTVSSYPYLHADRTHVDIHALSSELKKLKSDAAVLFHASCHNPSGIDLTHTQWQEIATILTQTKSLALFDFAYQGFGESVEDDAFALRSFLKEGLSFACAWSNSKNFSLYSQRVGAGFIFAPNNERAHAAQSHVKRIIRALYSNPPRYGAALVTTVLADPELKKLWLKELDFVRNRVKTMRERFVAGLESVYQRDLAAMKQQCGLFSFSQLLPEHVSALEREFGIYMPQDGRVNIAGLNTRNMTYVLEAIGKVL